MTATCRVALVQLCEGGFGEIAFWPSRRSLRRCTLAGRGTHDGRCDGSQPHRDCNVCDCTPTGDAPHAKVATLRVQHSHSVSYGKCVSSNQSEQISIVQCLRCNRNNVERQTCTPCYLHQVVVAIRKVEYPQHRELGLFGVTSPTERVV
jgi:hypothetical protein